MCKENFDPPGDYETSYVIPDPPASTENLSAQQPTENDVPKSRYVWPCNSQAYQESFLPAATEHLDQSNESDQWNSQAYQQSLPPQDEFLSEDSNESDHWKSKPWLPADQEEYTPPARVCRQHSTNITEDVLNENDQYNSKRYQHWRPQDDFLSEEESGQWNSKQWLPTDEEYTPLARVCRQHTTIIPQPQEGSNESGQWSPEHYQQTLLPRDGFLAEDSNKSDQWNSEPLLPTAKEYTMPAPVFRQHTTIIPQDPNNCANKNVVSDNSWNFGVEFHARSLHQNDTENETGSNSPVDEICGHCSDDEVAYGIIINN